MVEVNRSTLCFGNGWQIYASEKRRELPWRSFLFPHLAHHRSLLALTVRRAMSNQMTPKDTNEIFWCVGNWYSLGYKWKMAITRNCTVSAYLKNPFAVSKAWPMGGWKKEYLQPAISNNHVKYASEAFRKSQTWIFNDDQVPFRTGATEKATLGLICNIHFLVSNSVSLNK